jgi:hypothetical protein
MPYPSTDPDLFSGKLFRQDIERTALLFYWGGLHGDCAAVRHAMKHIMINCSRVRGTQLIPRNELTRSARELGFRAAKFCPIPIGDSPSSKRMYDVMNYGCVPVALSDDLVWAFSDDVGGPIGHASFSLRMPQIVVQLPADALLHRFAENKEMFGRLPSGLLLYDLLSQSKQEGGDYDGRHYINPLVQILLRIPLNDLETLQKGVALTGT